MGTPCSLLPLFSHIGDRRWRCQPKVLLFLHFVFSTCLPHCKAAKHSEDAQKARKEAEAAHTEKKNALTDAAATKKLGPGRMYFVKCEFYCEMFHCEVSLCDTLWSFVVNSLRSFSGKQLKRPHRQRFRKPMRHGTLRHGSTALLPFCSFCFAVSSSSAFDLPWDALILWITLIIFDKFFDSFGFYAVNEIAGHCGCGCQSGRPILEGQTGSGCDGASRGWRSQKTHRLRCSASKNAMQSHALQMFVAFYGTGNVEIVALTLCTWSGSEHEVVHVWLFSRSSLGISQLHGLHWTWVLNHFEPR